MRDLRTDLAPRSCPACSTLEPARASSHGGQQATLLSFDGSEHSTRNLGDADDPREDSAAKMPEWRPPARTRTLVVSDDAARGRTLDATVAKSLACLWDIRLERLASPLALTPRSTGAGPNMLWKACLLDPGAR